MTRDQLTGIIWVVVAIIYGFGIILVDKQWWTLGGAAFIAIMAVTIPIWRQWLPNDVAK